MRQKVVTNCWLEAYFDPASSHQFVLENFFDKKHYIVSDSEVFKILDFATKPAYAQKICKFIQKKSDIGKNQAKKIVDFLIANNLLVEENSIYFQAKRKAKDWYNNGWSAALDYHVAIRNYPFIDCSTAEGHIFEKNKMIEYVKKEPVPPVYKIYKKNKRIYLDKSLEKLKKINLGELLKIETIENSNERKTVTKKQISEILYSTFGQTGTIRSSIQGEFLLKTNPSGGARHPIEAYLISLKSEIPKGIYHYSVKDNALELIKKEINMDELNKIITAEQNIKSVPKIIIVTSAVFARSMWRYREPRTYRTVMHDDGHIHETLSLTTLANKLRIKFGQTSLDSYFEKTIGLDSEKEPVIEFAVIW